MNQEANNPFKGSTVMIVDDNVTNLYVLLEYLTQMGFKTLIAEDGESAIKRASYGNPDIILLDIMMPAIDGFETCRRLKQNPSLKNIPVIFVTALSEQINKLTGFEVGAVDYITKPFHHEEVFARIISHLTIEFQKKELCELNRKLSETNAKLIESNAAKDRYFSIIAHDLRGVFNPLSVSVDTIVKLVERKSYDKLQLFVSNLKTSLSNANKLMENLLDWARTQRGKMECIPKEIKLKALIDHIFKLFLENSRQKEILLKNEISEETSAVGDENMLSTIFRNLIANAIKFTKSGGTITVSVKRLDEKLIEVAVSDNGVGINPDNINKLFRIDEKVKEIGTAGEKGTGLGLIICKEMIENNHGHIRVESQQNVGTTFFVTIPS